MTLSEQSVEDRRVQRTKKSIQTALMELTIQKGFAAVTVRDITEYAGINRATFYRHYQDKFDLLEQYANEVYQLLDVVMDADSPADEKPLAGLVRIFEHVREYANFYRMMFKKEGDSAFTAKVQHYVRKRLSHALPPEFAATPLAELYLSYVAQGSVGVLLWWLENNTAYSPDEMAAIAFRLSLADLNAMLTPK